MLQLGTVHLYVDDFVSLTVQVLQGSNTSDIKINNLLKKETQDLL
jgi:hypothetical protein